MMVAVTIIMRPHHILIAVILQVCTLEFPCAYRNVSLSMHEIYIRNKDEYRQVNYFTIITFIIITTTLFHFSPFLFSHLRLCDSSAVEKRLLYA